MRLHKSNILQMGFCYTGKIRILGPDQILNEYKKMLRTAEEII